MEALNWLKKYNRDYKHIQIVEANLNWIQGEEDYLEALEVGANPLGDPTDELEEDGSIEFNEDSGDAVEGRDEGGEGDREAEEAYRENNLEGEEEIDLNEDYGPSINQTTGKTGLSDSA